MWHHFRRLAVVVTAAVAAIAAAVYLNEVLTSYSVYFKYVYAALILGFGVFISRELERVTERILGPKVGDRGMVVGNVVAIVGYILSAVAALSYLSFSPTSLLAGAAASGLVLGLALQPTLGSFFAGLLILISGEIKPGDTVRILTWHIPHQWASNPGYKYFSPDQVYVGYLAEVDEIGLFFTTVTTEEGQRMKFPNTIIATDAAVVTYTSRDYIFNVRYEFPNRFDPRVVLKRVEEMTKDYPVLHVYINEQSDKEYYIVKVVLNAREKDHAALKSEILTRFILLHQELDQTAVVARK